MVKYCVLLVILAVCSVDGNVTTTSCQKEVSTSFLDVAIEMITKVKSNFPACSSCNMSLDNTARDCVDLLRMGNTKSGAYKIWPMNRVTENKSIDVYCDMETNGGGWTLIQRRGNFQRPKDYFFKDWKSYKEGFGDIEKDFWLGNDNIFALTNQKLYSARFDLRDVEQARKHAQYDTFWIDDENNQYTLHVSDYSGDAGDSLIPEQNNQKFSTMDRENDRQKDENCAQKYKGGWWYNACHQSNLNGLYHRGKHDSFADGVNWFTWKGYHESLDSTEIKIRPKSFRPSFDSPITPMK